MFDFRRIFARGGGHHGGGKLDPDSDYHPSDKSGTGLESEYQTLIAAQFRRWGISQTCVTIEVKTVGQHEGYDVFVGMVRLSRWERISSLRVLIGLPLLENKIRKSVRASWLADYSHFGGLWLHASEQIGAPGELRDLISQVAPMSAGIPRDSQPPGSELGTSSLGSVSTPDDQVPMSG